MPEQKCCTIDGQQVLWKHFRNKQGTFDIIKCCIGKPKPEKQWQSHHIEKSVVDNCKTNAALAAAVKILLAGVMEVELKAPKINQCRRCKHDDKLPPPAPDSAGSSSSSDPAALVMLRTSTDAQGSASSAWVFAAAELASPDSADAPCHSSAAELLAEAVQRFDIGNAPHASSSVTDSSAATSTPLQSRSTTSTPLTELSELHALFDSGGTPLDVEQLGLGRTLIRPLAQVHEKTGPAQAQRKPSASPAQAKRNPSASQTQSQRKPGERKPSTLAGSYTASARAHTLRARSHG